MSLRQGHHQHVIPTLDGVEHTEDEDCVCGPDVEHIKAFDGTTVRWIYIHHSLDGRELAETSAE